MRHINAVKSKGHSKNKVYIVESILDERVENTQKYYKVHWQGLSSDEDSWESESNLSNDRNLIKRFHNRQNSKFPIIDPLVPTTLKRTTGQREHSTVELQKRPMTKSRVGHFEYVPQNELVASKTKYFDDIRDGKIDLISNDLYSRVKTRRRCINDVQGPFVHDEDSLRRPSSLSELNDSRENLPSSLSRYSAPTSPKNSDQFPSGSFDDQVSTLSDRAVNPPPEDDMENTTKIPRISEPTSVRRRHIKRSRMSRGLRGNKLRYLKLHARAKKDSLRPDMLKAAREKDELSVPSEALNEVVSATPPHEQIINEPFPIPSLEQEICDMNIWTDTECPPKEPIRPRQAVGSRFQLLSIYMDLVNTPRNESKSDTLEDFPIVCPLDDKVVIASEADLASAIDNQYWSLVAAHSIKKNPDAPSSVNPLLSVIIGGEGNPFLIRRLFDAGYAPESVDSVSGWPIFLIAVYLGRVHAVQAFLDAGVSPNMSVFVDGRHKTALGIAIAVGSVDMANLLLLNRANFYKVEEETTALNLITQILQAVTTNFSYDLSVRVAPSLPTTNALAAIPSPSSLPFIRSCPSLRSHIAPQDVSSLPVIDPPAGVTIPRSPYDHLPVVHTTTNSNQPLLRPYDKPHGTPLSPSTASLCQLHQLISSHHARLSFAVDSLMRRWLFSVGMALCGVVMPCQWIHFRDKAFTLSFPSPKTFPEGSALVLFLIHGSVVPPGCYHTWMDDDGPCFVERVFLADVEQRPLGRCHFVSTLYPPNSEKDEQCVRVEVSSVAGNACIAALVVGVKRDALPHSQQNAFPVVDPPRLRSVHLSTDRFRHRP